MIEIVISAAEESNPVSTVRPLPQTLSSDMNKPEKMIPIGLPFAKKETEIPSNPSCQTVVISPLKIFPGNR